MFGKIFGKKAEAAVQKFSGRTDFLEAVCAAAALIAAADGEIEDSEVKATVKAVKANKSLANGFDQTAIEAAINKMLERAAGGRVGRMGLWEEIREVAKDAELAQGVVLAALDVAEGDGEIEPAEKAVLDRLAKELSVDLARLLAA
jgi:tellurite resistance protein TerB